MVPHRLHLAFLPNCCRMGHCVEVISERWQKLCNLKQREMKKVPQSLSLFGASLYQAVKMYATTWRFVYIVISKTSKMHAITLSLKMSKEMPTNYQLRCITKGFCTAFLLTVMNLICCGCVSLWRWMGNYRNRTALGCCVTAPLLKQKTLVAFVSISFGQL